MKEENQNVGLALFPPIQVSWKTDRQELDICGTILVGRDEKRKFCVQLTGEAAIQLLRGFRSLLEHVDVDAAAAAKPRGLQ